MQQTPTFEKIEWSFETPEIVKVMVKKLDMDLKQIQTVLDCGWQYLSRGWIQTFEELNDLFKDKVNKTYIENFKKSIEQSIENSNQQIETNEEENNQEFENLTNTHNGLMKINEDVPHEEKHIKSIRLDFLQPAMQTQIQSLKNVQKYQNDAKNVSVGISKQLQVVKDQMLVDNNQVIVLQTQVEKTDNDLTQAIKKYERQLPEAQKIYDDIRFNIKAQNLENSFQTFNNIIRDLKQENLKLVNELSLTKIDYKYFEMEQLMQQIERLELLQLQQVQQFQIDLADTEKRLMEMIQSFINKFQLQHKALVEDMKVKSVQITDLIEECFSNNQLQQVEKQINEAQQRWSDDIQNFRSKYIEGALKEVQDLIVITFEKTLVIDAANILQNAKVFQNQLEEKHSQQQETQLSRKLFFDKETKQIDNKLGIEHRRALQMSTDRYEKIQKTVAQIGQNFDEILKKVESLIDATEFAELIDTKLDKAAVDIAFSVQCPTESYDQNPYIDTSSLSTMRVGGAPLNITVKTARERAEYMKNQQENINKTINLAGNQINNIQAKYDGLLIKIEDALNTLGFGKEKPVLPTKEEIINTMVNYDEKRSRELKHRVKSGARAYRNRQWKAGIDLDNYITEFQEEFGKGGAMAQ